MDGVLRMLDVDEALEEDVEVDVHVDGELEFDSDSFCLAVEQRSYRTALVVISEAV